jgi:hypothetical protein
LADLFTKALDEKRFNFLVNKIGMLSPEHWVIRLTPNLYICLFLLTFLLNLRRSLAGL